MKKVDAVCGEMESGRPYSVGLTMTVSYTHLDVYKRQPPNKAYLIPSPRTPHRPFS